ncbi:MAG TPA: YebC/PmpR family DNA-binding transcriptional regulator [Candidatus Sumerlaeota bacterium]|nr:MAG: putative transcriptional regulatory protein [candidate division BRC1 bacterium ADurb.Bin183]HOE63952.1 YebC/PmpR family DNA-binding transcriptional regulator [Candidatus Sumerlaeota bacterium]HRR31770.1 YebC/PmpR family DNA-binding transcriptional regulator [Candidatus Sumerlaeia bacterium]HON50778.1 YebC/PmpR family DNA-binding transcriptional regulator [Candidatus Sumerlaeota bacterium]HOR65472.1 YebC/PmpR family DNA-binding transcriptional regulator [Candidatus Sumerlaeota bacterium]
MSGHSKWHTIRFKKAATDAKRGKLFTKIIKEIIVAARMGGSDMESNARLRTAVRAARDSNMPRDNIERAVKRGAGELPGVHYEDFVYEAYGPGGVAIMIEGTTDNKNRTTPEIRHMLSKGGGNLGESGCVSWMFTKKGIITVNAEGVNEDKLTEDVIDAGADDIANMGESFSVTTEPNDVDKVRAALEAKSYKILGSEVILTPQNTVAVDEKHGLTLMKLLNNLEEHDDVSRVSANYDISDEIMERIQEQL